MVAVERPVVRVDGLGFELIVILLQILGLGGRTEEQCRKKKKKKIRNFKGIVRKLKEKIKEGKELLKNRKAFLKADVTYFAIWPP